MHYIHSDINHKQEVHKPQISHFLLSQVRDTTRNKTKPQRMKCTGIEHRIAKNTKARKYNKVAVAKAYSSIVTKQVQTWRLGFEKVLGKFQQSLLVNYYLQLYQQALKVPHQIQVSHQLLLKQWQEILLKLCKVRMTKQQEQQCQPRSVYDS